LGKKAKLSNFFPLNRLVVVSSLQLIIWKKLKFSVPEWQFYLMEGKVLISPISFDSNFARLRHIGTTEHLKSKYGNAFYLKVAVQNREMLAHLQRYFKSDGVSFSRSISSHLTDRIPSLSLVHLEKGTFVINDHSLNLFVLAKCRLHRILHYHRCNEFNRA
jgi:hypothetical protein